MEIDVFKKRTYFAPIIIEAWMHHMIAIYCEVLDPTMQVILNYYGRWDEALQTAMKEQFDELCQWYRHLLSYKAIKYTRISGKITGSEVLSFKGSVELTLDDLQHLHLNIAKTNFYGPTSYMTFQTKDVCKSLGIPFMYEIDPLTNEMKRIHS